MGRAAVVAGWVAGGPQEVVLAGVVGALPQQGGLEVVVVVEVAVGAAWGSRVAAGVGAAAAAGSREVAAAAGLAPAHWGLPRPPLLGSPPWA